MTKPYDCTEDVNRHRALVRYWMTDFQNQLEARAKVHDDSKLKEPEKSTFDQWTPELKRVAFGTEEYKLAMAGMGEGLAHHYRVNTHHPEHYQNGISGMTLPDLVEMFCDWVAAAQDKSRTLDIAYCAERFGLPLELQMIFANTLREIDYWETMQGAHAPQHAKDGEIGATEYDLHRRNCEYCQ